MRYVVEFVREAAEDIYADRYEVKDGFVTFYKKVASPEKTESGLIISTGGSEIELAIIAYNSNEISFITPTYDDENELTDEEKDSF